MSYKPLHLPYLNADFSDLRQLRVWLGRVIARALYACVCQQVRKWFFRHVL